MTRTARLLAALSALLATFQPIARAAAPVRITHDDVGCVMAGQHPRLDACFSPEQNVGRARVLFRAVGTDPWYYVDMTREGACHSAILPKPRAETQSFQYYVQSLDRAFFSAQLPERAPDQAFTPRVVKRAIECDPTRQVAFVVGKLRTPVKVGVALDPVGGALTPGAAGGLEAHMPLTGFSTDGVVVGSTGAAPSGSGEAARSGGATTRRIPRIALIGGLAGGGVAAAVVAGGGGDGGTAGTGSALSVAGQWVGRADQGTGLTFQFGFAGGSCTIREDVSLTLTQNGADVSGNAATGNRSFICSPGGQDLAQLPGSPQVSGTGPVNGTANGGGATTLIIGVITFAGTYTRTSMDLVASGLVVPGASQVSMNLKLTRAQ